MGEHDDEKGARSISGDAFLPTTAFCGFFHVPCCLLSSCKTSTGVRTSTRDETYAKNIGKLFIIADLPRKGWRIKNETIFTRAPESERNKVNGQTFKAQIIKSFSEYGIECACEIITGLELDDTIYQQKLRDFSPDAYFIVDCTAITIKGDNLGELLWSSDYDISLIDYPTNKRVWRMQASLSQMTYPYADGLAKKVFRAITEQDLEERTNLFGRIQPLPSK